VGSGFIEPGYRLGMSGCLVIGGGGASRFSFSGSFAALGRQILANSATGGAGSFSGRLRFVGSGFTEPGDRLGMSGP